MMTIVYIVGWLALTDFPRLGRAVSSVLEGMQSRKGKGKTKLPRLKSKSPVMLLGTFSHNVLILTLRHATQYVESEHECDCMCLKSGHRTSIGVNMSRTRFSLNSIAYWLGSGTDAIMKVHHVNSDFLQFLDSDFCFRLFFTYNT